MHLFNLFKHHLVQPHQRRPISILKQSRMASASVFQLSFLASLLSSLGSDHLWPTTQQQSSNGGLAIFPPTCTRIECPSFETIHIGDGFEIRRYDSTMWASTSPIEDISLVEATRTGFLKLFKYIQGENSEKETIEMTGPVMTEVSPSDGPFCKSSFVVSFYVPKKNQPDPPSATGLVIQKWNPKYVAVRQFGGFADDYGIAVEAAALQATLAGTTWAAKAKASSVYSVAQYNSPFEFQGRVNEIWMTLDIQH